MLRAVVGDSRDQGKGAETMQLTFWRVLMLLGGITLVGGLFRIPFMAGYQAGFNAGYNQGKQLFSQDAEMAREKLWELSVQLDSAGIDINAPAFNQEGELQSLNDSRSPTAATTEPPSYRLAN